jgi:hypothetical protein
VTGGLRRNASPLQGPTQAAPTDQYTDLQGHVPVAALSRPRSALRTRSSDRAADGVDALRVTGNVTIVGQTSSWAVYLGPDPLASPTSSTLNFNLGDVKANGVTVALGSDGSLSATYISMPGNTTDLVFDVTGYFVPGG